MDVASGLRERAGAVGALAARLDRVRYGLARAYRATATLAATLGFWTAVALPAAYPVVFLADIPTGTKLLVVAGLIAANAVALLMGHGHRAPDA